MSSDDDGYVHRPGQIDGSDDDSDGEPAAGDARGGASDTHGETHGDARDAHDVRDARGGPAGPSDDESLGRTGWVLVAVVVTATIVVPGLIYLFPAAPGEAGLPFIVAMLVLPFLPAVLLGVTAVWSLARSGK